MANNKEKAPRQKVHENQGATPFMELLVKGLIAGRAAKKGESKEIA